MSKKTALITGANKGIGFQTARELATLGFRVWLGSRDDIRGAQATALLNAEGLDVRQISIDVTDGDSVRAAASRVQHADGYLSVLVNNAGIIGDMSKKPSDDSITTIKEVFETNVFGVIRVTQEFLPLLRNAGNANIVMVSSGLGSLSLMSDPSNPSYRFNLLGYNSSKNAVNGIMLAFSKELAAYGVKVNAADPGYTDTDFNGHTGHRTVAQAAKGIVEMATLDETGPTGGYFHDGNRLPW